MNIIKFNALLSLIRKSLWMLKDR